MKKMTMTALLAVTGTALWAALPTVDNIALSQNDDTRLVTITYTLTDPAANSLLRFVYPADMAKDDGSLNYDALSRQDGVQSALAGFDLAVYDGSLDEGTPSGPVVLQNQLAICTFTIQDEGGADLTGALLSLTVSDGTNAYEVQAADQKAGFGFSPICVAVLTST